MSLSAIIQHKYAIAGPARQDIASATPVAISGLSVTITPVYSDSIIFVKANIVGNHNHVTSYGVYKDGSPTVSTTGYNNYNEPNMHGTTFKLFSNADYIEDFPIMHYETSGSTVSRTYAIYGTAGWDGTAYALRINNRNNNDMASFSYMEVFEVKN